MTAKYQFSDEESKWLHACLRKAECELDRKAFDRFLRSAEKSIQWFLEEKKTNSVTYREKHDAIRALALAAEKGLYAAAENRASVVAKLRSEIENLPAPSCWKWTGLAR
jgi:hypothetical protein